MTTQDIYSWVQMGLQIVIGGGIVLGISRYFGILRRAIESQEKTIAAQAEQMKAQSTVLQDFERLNKLLQQVINTIDAPAMLQRWQDYQRLVDVQSERLNQELRHQMGQTVEKTIDQMTTYTATVLVRAFMVTGRMMRFIPPSQRLALIDATDLLPVYKEHLYMLADEAPYQPIEDPSTEVRDLSQLIFASAWAKGQRLPHPSHEVP